MMNNHSNSQRVQRIKVIDYAVNKIRWHYLLALLVALYLSQPLLAQTQVASVFELINERLGYMEDVALFKAENNLPVEDLVREAIVIENAVLAAESVGLSGDSIEDFFVMQINAAKAIQYRSLADWLSSPRPQSVPDLENGIRPKLTELGDKLVAELALYLDANEKIDESQRESFHQQISVKHVSVDDKNRLFDSLLRIRNK